MKNIDILTTILSEVTTLPRTHWDRVIRAAVAAGGKDITTDTAFLVELPDDEAARQLRQLRQDKAGVLGWLINGGIEARQPANASRLQQFKLHLANRHN